MSLEELGISPDFVVSARRWHKGATTGEDLAGLRSAAWCPLFGGRNNGVYSAECGGRKFCFKLYKADERQRAPREWEALNFLAGRGYSYSPRPFYFEEDPEAPLVVMEFAEGVSLGGKHLDRAQLRALVEAQKTLNAIPFEEGHNLFRVLDGSRRLEGMKNFMQMADPNELGEAAAEALAMWREWLQGPDPETIARPAPLVFSRVDPNLANCLWDGTRMRIVDFEYSGWADRPFDIAEVAEHVQSRGTPEAEWGWFVEQFELSAAERRRFAAAKRFMALFWVMLLWRGARGQDASEWEKFAAQVERTRRLCGEHSSS